VKASILIHRPRIDPQEDMEEPTSIKVQDEDRLAQLGYKQELRRDWSMLQNFGVSFSIIVSNRQVSLNSMTKLRKSTSGRDGLIK